MPRILELDHIALNVRDVDRSLDFYGRVLGLEVLRLEQFRAEEVGFVSVRVTPETIIDLMPCADGPQGSDAPARLNHFCLVTDADDLEAVRQRLEAEGHPAHKGVVPRWGARGMGLSIYVRDPDGNEVEIRTYVGVAQSVKDQEKASATART